MLELISTITERGSLDIEYRICWPNNEIRWVRNRSHIVVTNKDAVSIRIEGIITDISDRKRAEKQLIHDTEAIIQTLQQIRKRKIQISIDDFGTGYSSLSYLSRFPINNLKIDRSFVGRMHQDNDSFEIVRTITALAHTLGMDVTAEGIEHPEQVDHLTVLGCEYGQGYFSLAPWIPGRPQPFCKTVCSPRTPALGWHPAECEFPPASPNP